MSETAVEQRVVPRSLRFGVSEADAAGDEWGFNCGPASLCAVFGLTPAEVRPHMGDFEQKGYTNPSLMTAALRSLGASWSQRSSPTGLPIIEWPEWGLARVQWSGPWTKEGVPMRVRYRHTHWVGSHRASSGRLRVFDVNATCVGGWLGFIEWSEQLVPWLLKQCEPKADGLWWLTHAIEVKEAP